MNERDIRIVVFNRGYIVVGRYELNRNDLGIEEVIITNGFFIRRWGTTKGLGELVNGPTKNTVLDPAIGVIREPWVGQVLSLQCNPGMWKQID